VKLPLALTMSSAALAPPIPPREDDRVIHVGAAPPGWKADLPRQSEASQEVLMDPPVALPDPYGWLRDETRTTPAVLEHLKAENAYTQDLTAHLDPVRTTLYDEMLSAIQETDYRTPRPDGDFLYYTRTMEGKSYTIHCRAPKVEDDSGGGDLHITWDQTADSAILPGEEVILDVNQLAEGKSYCSTGSVRRSPSHKYLAYSADFSGGETFSLHVKELGTDQVVFADDTVAISGSIRWGADDDTLFYLKMDEAHRPYQVYRRKLASADEVMLLEESDELYWMGIYKSLDGKYLFVESSSKETSEIHYLDLQDPTATLQCVAARRLKVLYEAEHREGQWWIQSNVGGLPNMALWAAPAVPDCEDQWKLARNAQDDEVLFDGTLARSLDGISCFKNHVVASGREGGLPRIWFLSLSAAGGDDEEEVVTKFERLTFEEEAYDVSMGANYEYETDSVVVGYDSLVTPTQSLEISLKDPKERKVLKERAVPGYDRTLYACERTTVLSRSGTTEIPISLVYRLDVMEEHRRTGEALCVHLYGKFRLAYKVIRE
jgi:oligopeptidase B